MQHKRKTRLVKYNKDDRQFFTATFDGYKITGGSRGVAYRYNFKDIRDEDGIKVAEYTWFDNIKAFNDLNLREGEVVTFKARPVDFALRYPTYKKRQIEPDLYLRLMNPTQTKKLTCPVKRYMPEDDINDDGTYRVHINFK